MSISLHFWTYYSETLNLVFLVPSFQLAKETWSALKNVPFGEMTTFNKFEIWKLVMMERIITRCRILSLLVRCAHNLCMHSAWKSSEYARVPCSLFLSHQGVWRKYFLMVIYIKMKRKRILFRLLFRGCIKKDWWSREAGNGTQPYASSHRWLVFSHSFSVWKPLLFDDSFNYILENKWLHCGVTFFLLW